MKFLITTSILFYKKHLSPFFVFLLGGSCRFTPTCSEYALRAVEKHGVVRGIFLSTLRVLRCNPLSKVSFDPVK